MSNPVKQLRGQVRIATKDLMPEVLSQELLQALEKRLLERLDQRIDAISSHINNMLAQIDSRSKDVQAYVVRQSANQIQVPKEVEEVSVLE